MRYISLFSGIEAASVAWAPLGWEPIAFSEIEPFPCAVLEQRFPDVPNLGDITKIDWKEVIGKYGAVDLVVGGSPCQSFSIAGDRTGLQGASGLMFEYIRAVREIRPVWFLWENVFGALSSERGGAFAQLLAEMVDIGYELAWRVLDSQFFGVAQRRRRCFLVGHLGVGGAAEILFEPESVRWDYPSSGEKRAQLAADLGRGAQASLVSMAHGQAKAEIFEDGLVPTLSLIHEAPIVAYALRERCGKPGGGKGPLIQEDVSGSIVGHQEQAIFAPSETGYQVRRLTPLECERLQGFPDNWTRIPYRGKPAEECPDNLRYKAIGNSFAVPVVAWIGKRIDLYEKGELNEL